MDKNTKPYGDVAVKRLERSRAEIIGSIPSEVWENHRTEAVKNINESVTVDGFRKGMVPENVLISKVGEMAILEEMAELALGQAYVGIIVDNKLDAIGKPQIQVTKLAKGNPLEFKIVTAVVPAVTLPDYKKIAQDEIVKQNPDAVKLTDEELETTITELRRSRASKKKVTTESSGGVGDPDHVKATPAEEITQADKSDLPELTDDFVKTFGAFGSVSDFKDKLSKMLLEEKRDKAREKLRIAIADDILAGTTVELPDILVESELARSEAQFTADIEKMGVKLEDYLKHAKKTIDEIRTEWRPHAEKKAKLQLILNAIAEKEKLFPTSDEVEHEVKHILEHYKDADKERVNVYAETVLTNEKVFQFLEK